MTPAIPKTWQKTMTLASSMKSQKNNYDTGGIQEMAENGDTCNCQKNRETTMTPAMCTTTQKRNDTREFRKIAQKTMTSAISKIWQKNYDTCDIGQITKKL